MTLAAQLYNSIIPIRVAALSLEEYTGTFVFVKRGRTTPAKVQNWVDRNGCSRACETVPQFPFVASHVTLNDLTAGAAAGDSTRCEAHIRKSDKSRVGKEEDIGAVSA